MGQTEQFKLEERAMDDEAARLCTWLDDHQNTDVSVEASEVERLSVPVVQVLICAQKQWQMDEVPFQVVDPSDAFLRVTGLLGLAPDFFLMGEA